MTAICYSQLSGFRSPWGGAGGRCWQEAGWFTGPPPPPPLPTLSWLWALHVSPFASFSSCYPSLFSQFSLFVQYVHPYVSSFLIHTFTFNPPLLFSLLHFTLFIQDHHPSAVDGNCGTSEEREWERGEVWMEWSQKKVLNRYVLIIILISMNRGCDTQHMEAIKEL